MTSIPTLILAGINIYLILKLHETRRIVDAMAVYMVMRQQGVEAFDETSD